MRNLKDAEGKNLSDARLRDYARPHYEWIDRAYKEASGLVHFSDRHVFRSVQTAGGDTGHVTFHIGDIAWPAHVRAEVEDLFGYATGQVLSIVEEWGRHKVGARTVRTPVRTPAVEKSD